MNKKIIGVLLFFVLCIILFSNVELFEKSNNFDSGNSFILLDNSGKISLSPVSGVDTAINNSISSLAKEADAKYQTIELAETKKGAADKYQTIELAETKKGAAAKYQPKGKYLDLNKAVQIQNKGKGGIIDKPSSGNFFGAYGDRGGFYNHTEKGGVNASFNQWYFRQQ